MYPNYRNRQERETPIRWTWPIDGTTFPVAEMPNPRAIMFRGALLLAVAAICFGMARRVQIVEVTVISDGSIRAAAVAPDDPIYREELGQAQSRALPYYAAAGVVALIAVLTMTRAVRLFGRRPRGV